MLEAKQKHFNANSVGLILVGILVAISGWGINETVRDVKRNQDKMWDAIMPRTEIESRIEDTKTANNRIEAELVEVRTRLTSVEMSLIRLQKQ